MRWHSTRVRMITVTTCVEGYLRHAVHAEMSEGADLKCRATQEKGVGSLTMSDQTSKIVLENHVRVEQRPCHCSSRHGDRTLGMMMREIWRADFRFLGARWREVCSVTLHQSGQYHIIVSTNYLQGLFPTERGITGSILASLVVNRSAVILAQTECSNHTAHVISCRYMPQDSLRLCVGLRWVTFRSDHLPSMHRSTFYRPRHICNRLPQKTPSPKRSEHPTRVQASSHCVL